MRRNEISSPEIRNILFQTRYTRSNAYQKPFTNKCGNICPILVNGISCSKHVMDLRAHLRRIHRLSPSDSRFIHAINSATICQKKVFYKSQFVGKLKMNSLEKIGSNGDIQSASDETWRNFESDEATSDPETNCITSSTSDDDSNYLPPVKSSNFPSIVRPISVKFDNAILSFKHFLPSQWGGSNTKSAVKMHITNIIFLVNGVGEGHLFDPDVLNSYLSKKRDCGINPSTLISRLDSLERFYKYLVSHHPDVLPNRLNRAQVVSLISGVKKSLFKAKNKRQRDVMAKNRENYPQTTDVLKQWREKRKFCNELSLFEDYASDENMQLTEEDYTRMRDFLIVELIVPNGQRSGIIQGMQIGEVERAKFDVTTDGYHRLIVADHKTGDSLSATLFLYPEISRAMNIFVEEIIPKLTIILSAAPPDKTSIVFRMYSGGKLLSSRVTPILRRFLLSMGIHFNGTITDLRKAAATLTGKFQPSLHELMAAFMGHSRKAHEKYYKIQMGHHGLTEAFKSLESFQTNPHCDSSSFTPHTSNISSNSSLLVSENSNSILPTSDSEFIIPTGDRFSSTIDEQNVHCQSGDSFIMEPSSLSPHKLEHRKPTNDQVLKKCSHPSITKLHSMKTRFKDGANKTNYKSIFNLIFDNSLFSSVFESQIQSVKEHSRISKVEIMDTARKSRQFAEFLRFLDSRFPLSIVESKIMDKVRGLGVSQRNQLDIPQMVYSPSGSNTTLSEFLYT